MQYGIITKNDYAELIDRFLVAQDVGERTLTAYKRNIGYFLTWINAENGGIAKTKTDIIKYKQHLLEDGKKPSTVNAYLTAVRRLFEWLESEGIAQNVAKYVKSIKTDRSYKKKPLSDLQWTLLRESLSGDDLLTRRDLLLFALGIGNGLRTVEMSRLNVEDIQQSHGRTIAMIMGKGSIGGEKKPVILSEGITALLKEYIALRSQARGAIFTNFSNNGDEGRLSTSGIRYIIKKRLNDIGINDPMITAHSLRHSHAMQLLDAGVSIEKIQQSMRHDSIESTMIYLRTRDLYSDPASLHIDVLAS